MMPSNLAFRSNFRISATIQCCFGNRRLQMPSEKAMNLCRVLGSLCRLRSGRLVWQNHIRGQGSPLLGGTNPRKRAGAKGCLEEMVNLTGGLEGGVCAL